MLLKSYSFTPREVDTSFFYDLYNEIDRLHWYFVKFCRTNVEEAEQRTLYHALTHFDADKGGLSAYVKKLAREITKENSRLVYVDFLENTLSDSDEEADTLQSTVDTGRVADFSNSLLDEIYSSENGRDEVSLLALEFMGRFITLCDALISGDTNTTYYPEVFIRSCLNISKRVQDFNRLCLDIYMEYGDTMKWFLAYDTEDADWVETDFIKIQRSYSKKIFLVDAEGQVVDDADVDDCTIWGSLGTGDSMKRLIQVRYYDLWEHLCELIDSSETNILKFVIDKSYVVRTLGGSLSGVNVDLFTEYDIIRDEILTNVLRDTGGRLLNVGSENFYLVCASDMRKTGLERTIHGYNFTIPYIDVTSLVV